eukprot:10743769-Lingulodinium_polyedra.AAC.1
MPWWSKPRLQTTGARRPMVTPVLERCARGRLRGPETKPGRRPSTCTLSLGPRWTSRTRWTRACRS